MKKAEFLRKLITSFSDSELREICLELEVDYEILPGMSKADKARELILYLERRECLSELSEICQRLRPNVTWLSSKDLAEVGGGKEQIDNEGIKTNEIKHHIPDELALETLLEANLLDICLICYDHFETIYKQIRKETDKATLIRLLVQHAKQTGQINKLNQLFINLE